MSFSALVALLRFNRKLLENLGKILDYFVEDPGTPNKDGCSSFMRRLFGILALSLLSMPISASGQEGPCPIVREGPHEITPLESLIHYPKEAKKNGIEGMVTMEALIEKDGSVSKVHILKSSDSIFNQEAVRTIKSARFKPAMEDDDTPTLLWVTRTIKFSLKSKPRPKKVPVIIMSDSTRTLK